jgi:prolipoprotein diacylglyceryl transferase
MPNLVTAIVAAIPPPPARGLEFGPLEVRFYGLAIALGALAAIWLVRRRYAALGGDPDLADRAGVWAALFAVVGARVGYILPRLDRYAADPASALAIWEGGLTFFGALAGGTIGLLWYLRRREVPISTMLHAAAPAVPLAQAIGRWGNYFNQELFGRPTGLPWGLRVDPEHRPAEFQGAELFHPTFLYESLWNLCLVGLLLWIDRRHTLRRGSLFFVYLIGYGTGRFWIELLRIDTEFRLLGLSRNNFNALLIVVVGIVGLAWWERRRTSPTTAEPPPVTHGTDRADTPTDERPPPTSPPPRPRSPHWTGRRAEG